MEAKHFSLTILTGTVLAFLTSYSHAQTVFVADGHDTIWEIQDGAMIPFSTGIGGPQSIAFAPNGHLFSADIGSGSVLDISMDQSRVAFVSGTHQPDALAFDGSGNLFLASQQDGTVVEYPNIGGVLSTTPTVILSNLLFPGAMAIDSHGNIYVPTIDSTGTIPELIKIDAITHAVTVVTTALDVISGLTFDSKGNLYAAMVNDNDIAKITPTGVVSFLGLTGLAEPTGVAFDPNGDMYVTNEGHADGGYLSEFANTGGILSATPTTVASGFPGSVHDVAISPFTVPEPSALTLSALGIFVGQLSIRRRRPGA